LLEKDYNVFLRKYEERGAKLLRLHDRWQAYE